MSKVNTLFAYFSKTPKKTDDNQVLSPKNNNTPKSKTSTGTPDSVKQHSKNGDITPGKRKRANFASLTVC